MGVLTARLRNVESAASALRENVCLALPRQLEWKRSVCRRVLPWRECEERRNSFIVARTQSAMAKASVERIFGGNERQAQLYPSIH